MLATVKPKSKHVSSNSCSRRSNSPEISRNLTTPAVKRSVSAYRRRNNSPDLSLKPNNAGTVVGAEEVSAASKLLVTSTRSLSVSFQGESFSLQTIKKTKIPPQLLNLTRKNTPERKITPTPLRGKVDHVANTKPMDQYLWPGRIRQANVNLLLKRLNLDSVNLLNPDGNSGKDSYSDTDSVSSGSSSSEIQENGLIRLQNGSKGIIVSSKFWQESISRMRRLQGPSSPISTSPGSKVITPQKKINSKRFSSEFLASSSTSLSSGTISPRRNSFSGISTNFSETHSVLSFAVDVRRGKVGENRFFDAHLLRLLYNRQLQWRFVNARTEDMILKQKFSVEENLWNAWISIADLRDSVTKKRHRLQLLRQKLKLASILKTEIVFLEDWGYLDKNHSISLLGAIEALKASTLRLPVGAGATVDLQSMKDAINSAIDVMQAMFSSTHSLCLQVEEVNLMATELAKVSAKERVLLRICKDFLSILSALKVKDCSLKTHMLQMSHAT